MIIKKLGLLYRVLLYAVSAGFKYAAKELDSELRDLEKKGRSR